jgi:hypothetical protein
VAAVIDAVAEGRQVFAAVVEFEGKDYDAVPVLDHALVSDVRFKL